MNNNTPLISIITPTYNDENYIVATINSVLSQTFTNFELIIIDDCSIDSTVNKIKQFKDKRIKFFQNEVNSGAAHSRNRGLKEASGDYIAFLDGDDIWKKEKLEKQLNFMISNDISFSCTEYYVMSEDGEVSNIFITAPRKITHSKFMRMGYIGCLTAMYKRSVYPNLEIPNDIYKRNDYALWLKLSEKVPCFLLKEKLAFYRKRRKSISSGSKISLLKYHKILFSKLYGFNSFRCSLLALRNALYFVLKNLFYRKRER